MKQEFKRKLFHMLGGIYLFVYAVLPRPRALFYLGILGVLITAGETVRLVAPGVNAWCLKQLGSIARPDEQRRFSGIFWTWLGCWLTMLVFVQPRIVLPAIEFLVFGDAAAALVGKAFGKHPWPGHPNKSFEGSAAFALVSLACGFYFFPFWMACLSALVVAWIESRRLPWNDNFWIPLAAATSFYGFSKMVSFF